MQYRQIRVICGKGSGPGQFAEALNGIGIDAEGTLYAVGDRQVKVFDAEGVLLRRWPTDKPGYCVAFDENGAVYVGEAGQIEVFDRSGTRVRAWRDSEKLEVVTSIGFHGNDVLCADAKDRCIRRFDSEGKWLADIGKDNNTKGFLIPNGYLDFCLDGEGVIHAANPAKHRVERYSLTGKLLGYFGKFGTHEPEDFPGCCNPTNLTLSPAGHVVVTEKAGPRMKVYDAAGKLLAVVGSEAFDANCKNMDVAVDKAGRVYVADTVRLSIIVFAPVETNMPRSADGDSQPQPGEDQP